MQKEGTDNILAEDKKKKRSFLIIMFFCAFAGGITGYTSGMMRERVSELKQFSETVAAVIVESSYYLNVIVTVIAITIYLPLYRSSRRLYESWDGEDEAVINRIESRLCLALSIVSIQQVLTVMITLICAQSHVKLLDTEGLLWGKEICFLVGWIGALTFSMAAQRRAVNMEKEINPEKRGSVYDIRFQRKWFESCDEAEKLIIYQASYHAHRATAITCITLSIFCLLGSILWGIGFLPVCVIDIIWLVDTLTYCISSYKLSVAKQIR